MAIIGAVACMTLPAATAAAQPQQPEAAQAVPIRAIDVQARIASRLDPSHGRPYEDYRLHLAANASVRIEMESPNPSNNAPAQPVAGSQALGTLGGFDTYLELRSPDGRSLASNDDRGDGSLNSRIVFTAPTEGDYIIRAMPLGGTIADGQNPTYLLRVDPMAPAPDPTPLLTNNVTGDLNDNGPQTDFFGATNNYKAYWFEGRAGDRVQARLTSNASQAVIQIVDSGGGTLAANVGEGSHIEVVTVLPSDGRYLIRVQTPFHQAMHYSLFLATAHARPREDIRRIQVGEVISNEPITLESNVNPKPDGSGEADFFYRLYTLQVLRGQPLTVLLDAPGFRPVLEAGEVATLGFIGAMLVRSGPDGRARLVLQPFKTGIIYIRVRSSGLALGTFRLQVVRGVVPPTR
jgi:hypothetical protein